MKSEKPKLFTILKIIAPIMLTTGIILIIVGATTGGSIPKMGMFIPGVFLTFFSIPAFMLAFSPEIRKFQIKTQKYIQEQNEEDLTDIASTNADISSHAVSKIASSVKQGLKETKFCKHCGTKIDADSKFCKKCGKEQ